MDQFLLYALEKWTWLRTRLCNVIPKASPEFCPQDELIGQSIIFPKSMLFSPDSVPVLGPEIFPLTFVACVSHVLHMGWPGLTVGRLPVPLCWGSWCLVHPRVASPPCHFGGTHPVTERWSGGWTYFMAILRWLLQENLLPSVR